MKIVISTLHVRPRYNPSQEVYVSGLLSGIAAIKPPDMEFAVLVNNDNCCLFDLDGFETVGCPYIPSTASRLLWEQRKLPGMLDALGADVFHGTGNSALFRFKGRQVVTVHLAVEFAVTGGLWHSIQVAYRKWIIAKSIKSADGVICASEYLRDGLFRIHRTPEQSRSNFAVIPMGVDFDTFSPALPERESDAETLRKFDLHEPYFLAYNDVLGLKNMSRILEAWLLFRNTSAEAARCGLVLIGDPAGEKYISNKLAHLCDARNRVKFAGFVSRGELAALYRRARAMIFPSLAESFGLCIVEAMACGTPVLTSNVTAMPESAGGAAFIVDPHDAEAIAAGMELLFSNEAERARLIAAGLERVRPLTWRATAENTIELYRKVSASN